jgi:hypothetical protein
MCCKKRRDIHNSLQLSNTIYTECDVIYTECDVIYTDYAYDYESEFRIQFSRLSNRIKLQII